MSNQPPLRFAANLSFLFTERSFLDRFAAARAAGFTAVEFHFPYAEDKESLAATVQAAGVEVILFNLPPGDWDAGERGIACHPARIAEFQEGVRRAIDYASALGCSRLNCLTGLTPTDCSTARAREVLMENLRFAATVTQRAGIELMMEPLNHRDTPGYFVPSPRAGLELIAAVGHPNLKLQYDIYHAQVMEGDLARCLEEHLPQIGHIQFADNPGRHEPGTGEINFPFLFAHLRRIGYPGWVAAEYKPSVRTEDSLGWMRP
jgi:hydroxypyruvate isomerase